MKKISLYLCGLFLAASFTGCIEIVEELILEKKGNGHFRQKIDMKEAAGMINMMKAAGEPAETENQSEKSDSGKSSDPGQSFTEKWQSLKGLEGISNLQIVSDTINYLYTVDFDFSGETALNNAMHQLQNNTAGQEVYSIGKSGIKRNEIDMSGIFGEEEDESAAEMTKAMMGEMKFQVTVTVPGKIKSVSNKNATVSDKNSVTIQATFSELAEKKKSLGFEIDYK